MEEKYYSRLAVSLMLTRINENKEKEILLQLRKNTGYMDGMYDFACSGHVEKGESYTKALIREAKEEIGINLNENNLIFLAVNHNYQADHVQLFFTTKNYEGIPKVCEPDKCGEVKWFKINALPKNVIPYVANVIEDINYGIQFDDGNFTMLENYKKDKNIYDEEKEFHKKRIAFMIINNEILFLKGSSMSHKEWFDTLKIQDNFNNIIRGFYYNNRIIFYKGDFIYDEETIKVAKKFYPVIIKEFNLDIPELWVGQQKTDSVTPLTSPWQPTLKII